MTDLQPVFCGNFEYNINVREIERLFDDFGPIERVDMKSGYAFVFMRDSRDGDDAIHKLDGMEFGRRRRPLRVEWAKVGMKHILHFMMIHFAFMHLLVHSPACLCSCSSSGKAVPLLTSFYT
ncbi:TPA: Serine/arginine-rich splicing factor rs40 [Trebouxia sp. C0005]